MFNGSQRIYAFPLPYGSLSAFQLSATAQGECQPIRGNVPLSPAGSGSMLQQTAKEKPISQRTSLVTRLLVTVLLAAYFSLAALQVSHLAMSYKVSNNDGSRDRGRAGSKRYGIDVNDPTYPGPGVRTAGIREAVS